MSFPMHTSTTITGKRKLLLILAPAIVLLALSFVALNHAIAQYSSTAVISLSSNENPSHVGEFVTFTATVQTQYVSGTVTFYDNSVALGSAPVQQGGTATLTTAQLAIGNHPITAVFYGTGNIGSGTSSTLYQVVDSCTTTFGCNTAVPYSNGAQILLNVNKTQASSGENVSFSAYVSGNQMLGTVTFYDGNVVLASKSIRTDGSAGYSTSQLSVGTHTITAIFSDNTQTPRLYSAPVSLQILPQNNPYNPTYNPYYPYQNSSSSYGYQPNTVTFSLTSDQNPSTVGNLVTLRTNVGMQYTGAVVTLFDNGTLLASVNVGSDGTASFSTSQLSAGTHTITATLGNLGSNLVGSSSTLSQQVYRYSYRGGTVSQNTANPSYYPPVPYTNPSPVLTPVTGAEEKFFAPLDDAQNFLSPSN